MIFNDICSVTTGSQHAANELPLKKSSYCSRLSAILETMCSIQMSFAWFSWKTVSLKRIFGPSRCQEFCFETYFANFVRVWREQSGSRTEQKLTRTPTRITDLQKIWFCFSTIWITCIVASPLAMVRSFAALLCTDNKTGTRPCPTFGGLDGLCNYTVTYPDGISKGLFIFGY